MHFGSTKWIVIRRVARGGAWGAQAPPSFLITFFLKMIFNKIEFVVARAE